MNTATLTQVDRREKLSVAEFKREYLKPQRPVVITDAAKSWEALKLWTFDYFREHCGSARVVVYRYDPKNEFTAGNTKEMTLAEYVEGLTSHTLEEFPYYLRDNWRLFRLCPELVRQHSVPPYFFDWFRLFPKFMRMPYPRIFIGPKGAITPLHSDVWQTHAWLTQLAGCKRWLLFAPDQVGYLHGFKVRCEAPDHDKFPLYRRAKPLETVIGPGDTIWVPSNWSHWVHSLDASISLTYNYMGPGCFAPCIANTFKAAFSLDRIRRTIGTRLRSTRSQAA
jgi:hypothetical protein